QAADGLPDLLDGVAVLELEGRRQERLVDQADEAAGVADPLDGARCLHEAIVSGRADGVLTAPWGPARGRPPAGRPCASRPAPCRGRPGRRRSRSAGTGSASSAPSPSCWRPGGPCGTGGAFPRPGPCRTRPRSPAGTAATGPAA